MNTVQDGATVREHLEAIQRQTGFTPDALAFAPSLPDGLEPLWHDFSALHNGRGSNGFGPSQITFSEIDAYQRVIGIRFAPWQLDAIRRADAAYLNHYAEQRRAKEQN